MRKRCGHLSLAVGVLLAAACDNLPPRHVVVRAGRVWDGTLAPARTAQLLEVEDGTLIAMRDDDGVLPPGAVVIDARACTVLPGLIDAHVHLLASPACTPGVGAGLLQAARALQAAQAAGITTLADVGSPTVVTTSLRRYVGTARHRGPRLLTCGAALTAPGAAPRPSDAPQAAASVSVDGPQAAAAAVRALVEDGVDCIVLRLQARAADGGAADGLDEATACAAIAEAHRQETRAYVHATSAAGYARALACHADALLHGAGELLPAATAAALAAAGTPVLPALWAAAAPEALDAAWLERPAAAALTAAVLADLRAYVAANAAASPLLPAPFAPGPTRAAARAAAAAGDGNAARLLAAGVTLGLGSDGGSCGNPVGDPTQELQRLVQAGLTPPQALQAATAGSARALGLQDALGRVAPGYRADLIAVRGAPDVRLDDLTEVQWRMLDGVVQRPTPAWAPLGIAYALMRTWLTGG